MNTLHRIFCCLAMLGLFVLAGGAAAAPGKTQAGMSKAEQAVVEELSLARTQPQAYVKFLEAYRKRVRPNGTVTTGGRTLRTREGAKAVDEAIACLKAAEPLTALTGSLPLARAARDHVRDTGPKGLVGHDGADGSTSNERIARYGRPLTTSGENIAYGPDEARAIVMQLIIDDGVANRGHRLNIYNPAFGTVGIAIGPHREFGKMCVMDFADAMQETSAAAPGAP